MVKSIYLSGSSVQSICKFLLLKIFLFDIVNHLWASQVALVVKNPPASAGDARDAGSIPELGRASGIVVVPSPSHVQFFVTPWTAAC